MTVFALFGLFVAIIEEIRVRGQDVDPYLLGALSVFFVLGVLVLPLLRIVTAGPDNYPTAFSPDAR
jgi:hypothetical protein